MSRRPLFFSVLAVVAPLAAMRLLDAWLATLGLVELRGRLVAEAAFSVYVAVLLSRLHWWRDAGFTPPNRSRRLVAWLPLLLLPLLILSSNGVKVASVERMGGFTLCMLMVGFAEEGLVRGVVLRALLPGGAARAVLLSSLIFGLGHLPNIVQGATPPATIVQAIVATLLGIGFAGARVYTGTIWPAIGLHALIDLVDVAGRGFVLPPPRGVTLGRALVPILLASLYALYGWWLLERPEHLSTETS